MSGVPTWINFGGFTPLVNGTVIPGSYTDINFVGAGIVGTEDVGNGRYQVSFPAPGGSGTIVTADAATTSNHSLTGLSIPGQTLTPGLRVLVTGQTNGSENGIYTAASGTWDRDPSYDSTGELSTGLQVFVAKPGAIDGSWFYIGNSSAPVVGTDPVYFYAFSSASGASTFLALTDTPSAYTGDARQLLAIPDAENGVAFLPGTHLGPTDVLWAGPEGAGSSGYLDPGFVAFTTGTRAVDPSIADPRGSVLIGPNVARNLTSGPYNVMIGHDVGHSVIDAGGNILIGTNVEPPFELTSHLWNGLNIGNAIFGDLSGTPRIRISPLGFSSSQTAPLGLQTTTTTGSVLEKTANNRTVDDYVVPATPTHSALPGSIATRADDDQSALYQNVSVGTGTDWVRIGGLPPGYVDFDEVNHLTNDTWSVSGPGVALDSSDTVEIRWSSDLTFDKIPVGPGGRDSAFSTLATLIYGYVIWGPAQTVTTLTSLSPTTPSLPSGYTHFRRVTYAYANADGGINGFNVSGSARLWFYKMQAPSNQEGLNLGSATTLTPVDFSPYVPPRCEAEIMLRHSHSAGGLLETRLTGSFFSVAQFTSFPSGRTSFQTFAFGDSPSLEYEWSAAGGAVDMSVSAIRFALTI